MPAVDFNLFCAALLKSTQARQSGTETKTGGNKKTENILHVHGKYTNLAFKPLNCCAFCVQRCLFFYRSILDDAQRTEESHLNIVKYTEEV